MAIITLNDSNFNKEVVENKTPILVDFYATWCGPCKMMHPVLEDFANSYPEIRVGKIDVDQNPKTAGEFGIMSIPTILAYKNGEIVRTKLGYTPKEALKKMFD